MELFLWIEFGAVMLFFACLFSFFALSFWLRRDEKMHFSIPEMPDATRFAVIIPARNESRVIEALLRSVVNSEYPRELYDIYVIVETEDDPTVEIAGRYGANIFLRENLENVGKGYALDECLKSIFRSGKEYDAFLLLDADNLVSRRFMSRLDDAYQAGYDAVCGKRDNKDWNASAVSSSSALTFTVINSVQNTMKTAHGLHVLFSGTGFFVRADVLSRLGGWPFHSMTEDYEFSTFATVNGLKTCYLDDAVYYDEQPVRLWQSIIQRSRWVKGFFTVNARYRKTKKEFRKSQPKNLDMRVMRFGTLPLLTMVISVILYLALLIVCAILCGVTNSGFIGEFLVRIGVLVGIIYAFLVLGTAVLFGIEGHRADITLKNKIKTLFYHPFFLATYVVAAVRAIFLPKGWEVIEHTLTKDENEL